MGSRTTCLALKITFTFLALLFLPLALFAQVQVTISGLVTDETEKPIANAKVVLGSPGPGQQIEAVTDEKGIFNLNYGLNAAGPYWLVVSADGFYELKKAELVNIVAGLNIINARLIKKQALDELVSVGAYFYSPKHLEIEQIEMSQSLSDDQIENIPASRSTKLDNIIASLPGAVKDQRSELHFYGSASDQINWLFNSFNISDPTTGKFEVNAIGAKTVQGFNLFASRYSVEYGPGSGGTIAIETKNPTNKLKPHISNFFPGFRTSKGLFLSSWDPEINFSGPLKKDCTWFFLGLNTNYKKNIFKELPKGKDGAASWEFSGVSKFQFNLTPTNTFTVGFLSDHFQNPRKNLTPLDPVETTLNSTVKLVFFYLKDQIFLPSKAIVEFGYSFYHSTHREIPQGQSVYQYFNGKRQGHAPFDTFQRSQRNEFLANFLLPEKQFVGNHQIKTGANLSRLNYFQDIKRSSIEQYRLDNTRSVLMTFSGIGRFKKFDLESSWYWQDRWMVAKKPWLLFESGIRWDRDGILSKSVITPRFSTAIMLPWFWFKNRTKLSAGYSLVPEKSNIRLLTRQLDQFAIFRQFDKNGQEVGQPSVIAFMFSENSIKIPKTTNISFGIEQDLPYSFFLQTNFLRKHEFDGYAFTQTQPDWSLVEKIAGTVPKSKITAFHLQNTKKESYHSIEIALLKKFKKLFGKETASEATTSYSWSKSRSNAAVDINIDDPILHSETAGRTPWDTPHRLISWGRFALNENRRQEISYFLELRDGFPYSVHDEEGVQAGSPNGYRLPRHFTLNLRYSRKIKLIGRYWRLQLGIDNLTNHPNAMLINQNISSPFFGTLFGLQPRRFAFGINILGKKN